MSTPAIEVVSERLERDLRDSVVERDRPLGPMTTYRVGGAADLFVDVGSLHDLDTIGRVMAAADARDLPVLVVGRGSNLLVADHGVRGLVIHLADSLAHVTVEGTRVRAGGAASLPIVARQLVNLGIAGFEWAVGVPGSIGGAVRMNAGGHGSDMRASVRVARVLDLREGALVDVAASDLEFRYRGSAIAPHHVVVHADLELETGDPERGRELLAEIVRWRREHQPGGQNAGSVFTNPDGDSAGRLIDAAGLKGFRIGTAEVSGKHANFIQADPGGRAEDIVALMREVTRRVHEEFGVWLHAETVLAGFTSLPDELTRPDLATAGPPEDAAPSDDDSPVGRPTGREGTS